MSHSCCVKIWVVGGPSTWLWFSVWFPVKARGKGFRASKKRTASLFVSKERTPFGWIEMETERKQPGGFGPSEKHQIEMCQARRTPK